MQMTSRRTKWVEKPTTRTNCAMITCYIKFMNELDLIGFRTHNIIDSERSEYCVDIVLLLPKEYEKQFHMQKLLHRRAYGSHCFWFCFCCCCSQCPFFVSSNATNKYTIIMICVWWWWWNECDDAFFRVCVCLCSAVWNKNASSKKKNEVNKLNLRKRVRVYTRCVVHVR